MPNKRNTFKFDECVSVRVCVCLSNIQSKVFIVFFNLFSANFMVDFFYLRMYKIAQYTLHCMCLFVHKYICLLFVYVIFYLHVYSIFESSLKKSTLHFLKRLDIQRFLYNARNLFTSFFSLCTVVLSVFSMLCCRLCLE